MNRSTGFILVLLGFLAFFTWQLIAPFLGYILGAILIAFILYPLQRRLEGRMSPGIAAFLLIILALLALILPFAFAIAFVAGDAADVLGNFESEDLAVDPIEQWIAETAGVDVDLADRVSQAGEQAGSILVEQSTAWIGTITHALVGIGLALFLVYFLLKDGDSFVAWIRERTPLPDDVQDDLTEEIAEITRAVLAGHVLIAVIQGAIAGIGLFVTGIPNAAFWTFVMIVLALIPMIGSFLVWGPAVGYLFLTGEPVFAVGLAIYSLIVVGGSDDYLRPFVVDRYAELSPAIIILGVLGGAYAFGVIGLFIGPVLLGALIAVVNVYDENHDRIATGAEVD